MKIKTGKKITMLLAFFCMDVITIHAQQHHSNARNPFIALMDTMMQNMDTVPMSGSADIDFIRMMMPHHQGAIEMAKYEIKYGTNFEMIQLAKSIIAEQTNEIQQMQLWLRNNITTAIKESNSYQQPLMQTMSVMMQHMPASSLLAGTDKAFAAMMIPHHQAAIDMAKVILQYGNDKVVARLAQNIISSQQVEIEQMKSYLNQQL